MSKTYLITLTPLDWFFFGGERTLGEGQKADYLSKSNLFPQQSAILGLLRYQILKKEDLLFEEGRVFSQEERDRMNQYIGCDSFNMKKSGMDFAFGALQSISPVCIISKQTKEFYFASPLDEGYSLDFKPMRICLNGVEKQEVIDDNRSFNHKTYNNYLKWRSKTGQKVAEDIWMRKTKIGITKKQEEDIDDKNNFYKQEYLLLKNDFAYAFFVTLDDSITLESDHVYLGGQRSVFAMKAVPASSTFEQQIPLEWHRKDRIVLLCDTYVPNLKEITQVCKFHWSFSVPFRNIQTSTKNKNYYVKPEKSCEKYYFLQRGSVLYLNAGERAGVEEKLNNKYLQSAGYNVYI